MLILTRSTSEKVIINDNVSVQVLSVDGNQVKFGIDAPEDISVHRERIYQKIQAAGKQ